PVSRPQSPQPPPAPGARVLVNTVEPGHAPTLPVPRHNRELDVVEPAALRMEPLEVASRRRAAREEPARTNGNPRGEPARARSDITGMVAPAMPARRAEAPTLRPSQAAGGGRAGWLSEPLTRPPHAAEAPAREPPPPRRRPPQRPQR